MRPTVSAVPLPRLLVSVRDPAEAEAALLAGADLIDAKDPDRGALGALAPETVAAIMARLPDEGVETSAVADSAESLVAMARSGARWVKHGVPRSGWRDEAHLARIAGSVPGRVIAVLFAEDEPGAHCVPALKAAGFAGAMIDTAGKDGVRLPDLLGPEALAAFVSACRAQSLLCGLAGSLRIADIPALSAAGPDYLGFRGGLCRGFDRTNGIDPLRVAEAVRALRPHAQDAA
ncbi:(5-formylfuran-3-yl)methyl phosphate synthase [Methylobacterium sp. J-076]|uniref:(5-formylfuran-3-yl)methyl phosphate synthase n=1 Tax=Methylobacterium sp. J-076 TaxID=2836655 RepID=UPI001FB90A24|nr:(5-formylfuran-3-yl)methyl phosphate synthase [Methylobacterium sp. J-076]MCJ2013978.1 (5-formylfuran-3-yl)methyl phosphate synthase [Methylobacterium sp. J-076]